MAPPRVLAGRLLGLVNSHEVMSAARENDDTFQLFYGFTSTLDATHKTLTINTFKDYKRDCNYASNSKLHGSFHENAELCGTLTFSSFLKPYLFARLFRDPSQANNESLLVIITK